ncbi:MAG TPA: trypsin-like peptidase domain-containing protein, partial [Patescibacteria group bacterium]|nr:trypsin-like peptidase domain-containing protein [Patescibacteria group bacterium]
MKKGLRNAIEYIVLGVAVALAAGYYTPGFSAAVKTAAIKPAAQTAPLTDEQQGIAAVRAVKAAVVNIVGVQQPAPLPTSSRPSLSVAPAPSADSGTGFIISSDGLIVSNNHVISDKQFSYTVVFADGTQYPATIVGQDTLNDVALLKINASGLPAAALGDSDSLETGQTVFAIGNSLGKYQNTVTKGVVSALGRAVSVSSQDGTPQPRLQNLIQTDAAINPGNSGGPVINLAGQVVGMSTLIDAGGESLGFAVPVNTIKNSVQQLQAFGKVSRPYLGVIFTTLDPYTRALNNVSANEGALVKSVADNSPAAFAHIQAGDIIVDINKEQLTS